MNGETPPPHERALDEGAIRAQLDRVLSSDHFDASERNRRFLRYVVEECLAGRSQQIKAYCIAVSVFNREPSFDPQSDPIVRLEAGRLRRSLEHYYLTAGRNDPIRIVVPKGGYAPRFEPLCDAEPEPPETEGPRESNRLGKRPMLAAGIAAAVVALGAAGLISGSGSPSGNGSEEALAPATLTEARVTATGPVVGATVTRPRGIGIVVAPFRTTGMLPDAAGLASVLTDEVVRGLTSQTDLAVRLELPRLDVATNQDLRLAGSLQERDGVVRVVVHLTDLSTGTVLWSDQFEQPAPQGGSTLPQDLAASIVAPITDPQGPLTQTVSTRLRAKPITDLSARECAFLATDRRDHPADERGTMAACLERGIGDKTLMAGEAARLWAALSLLYADEHRAEFVAGPEGGASPNRPKSGTLDRALAAALHATELAPNGLRPLTALYTAYCLRRQYEPCFEAGDKALKAAPDDPKVLGDLGLWHVEAGDPRRGMLLMEHAMERDPAQSGRLLPAYSLARQRQGDPTSKLRADVTNAAPAQAALAVAFVQLGRIDEARHAASRALAADPAFVERAAREQLNHPLPPDLDATIRNSFAMVGLGRQSP